MWSLTIILIRKVIRVHFSRGGGDRLIKQLSAVAAHTSCAGAQCCFARRGCRMHYAEIKVVVCEILVVTSRQALITVVRVTPSPPRNDLRRRFSGTSTI